MPGLAATQRRHLEISGRLLGLDGDRRFGELQAQTLGLRGFEHQEARERWNRSRTRRERGRAVVDLLVLLDRGRDDRLLASGHEARLWGRPWRIDPGTGRRRPVPSRDPPTSFAVPHSSAGS